MAGSRLVVAVVSAFTLLGAGLVGTPALAVAAQPVGGQAHVAAAGVDGDAPLFNGVSPARLFDTRATGKTVDDVGERGGRFSGTRSVPVTGRGGIPDAGVGAVVLNVTATGPTAGGYLTVFPKGTARPNASNVNFVKGQTVPNAVIAKVGVGGQVDVFTSATTDVIVDVSGWLPEALITQG